MKRLVLSIVLAAVTVTAAIQLTGTGSAEAETPGCVTKGRYRVCTTDPHQAPGGQDFTIVEELQRQIDAAEPGGSIRIAMYLWTLKRVAYDLVDAHDRGVDVEAVIGTNDDNPDGNDTVIGILRDGGIPVTECFDGCLPNRDGERRGAMHNKFLLIDDATGTTVSQTSTNLTGGQVELHQNLLTTTDDDTLHQYYLDYWKRLAAKSWTVDGDTWTNADRSRKGDHDLSKAYVYPVDSGDPVTGVLNNVDDCRTEDDRIWVTHSIAERTGVRNRLIELHNAGCDVKVVTAKVDDERFMQAEVPGLGRLSTAKVKSHQGTHNKFMIIDAKYAGEWRKLVVTGSHNLSYNSLQNANDVMLRIIHNGVTNEYIEYFRDLYLAE